MSTPLWRQLYNAWEEAVTPGLQEVTASNGFRDVLAAGLKANAEITREVERMSRQWLHLLNLPAATDVRRVRQQVAGLEREIVGLRLELERQSERSKIDAPTGRSATTKAKGGKAKGKTATKATTTKGRSTRSATKTTAGGAGDIELTAVTSTNGRSAKA